LLAAIGRALSPLGNVQAALLFGSRATGRATDESDIDVAVLLDQEPGSSQRKAVLGGLIEALGRQLRADRLDIVILNGAPPNLAFHALKGGLVAFERSPELLHRFRVATYSRHSDYEPVERFFRGVTKKRAALGAPRG
jgi:uncharacterized protein